MLVQIDHHELADLRQQLGKLQRALKYQKARNAQLREIVDALRCLRNEAFVILEEWTETCAQICNNSYELTVRAKELRFPTPCAVCTTKEEK